MTGYGRGEYVDGRNGFVVEIKSVNHRFSDITVKQPRELMQFEEKLKELIKKYAVRGKIDVFVNTVVPAGTSSETAQSAVKVQADIGLIKAYKDAFDTVNAACGTGIALDARTLVAIPGALAELREEIDPDELWKAIETAATAACESFAEMRKREGAKLAAALTETAGVIRTTLDSVKQRAPQIPVEYKQRLEERIAELDAKSADPQRIAAEVAIFADKCSIDEEIARLDSHLSQLDALVNSDGAAGKQLDFLVQEMNREVNTIGSKANDLALTQSVLTMKNEVEKLREQIQNVE